MRSFRRSSSRTLAAVAFFAASSGVGRPQPAADARQVAVWAYARLADGADAVVIASFKGVRDVDLPPPGPLASYRVRGRVSTFEVRVGLKGKVNPEVELAHFALPDGAATIDGPRLLKFAEPGSWTRSEGGGGDRAVTVRPAPEYLLFLKRSAGGRYEPVTDQFDAADSVREVGRLSP